MKFARQRLLGLSVRPLLRIQVCSHVHLGVKSYPRGVTTNSDGGIESYEAYYPVFEAMQDVDMVLNLHGEVPSDASAVGLESFLVPPTLICVQNIHVINAEPTFLPHLRKLHAHFPRLRIVLEHATTRAAVETVKSLGTTVACTITAHHLALTVDDWAGQSWNYCKPVAKFPDDREALRQVIQEGEVELFCERHGGFSWIRSSTVFPRIRLRPTSFYEEVDELTGPWMRSRHLYIPYLTSFDSSPSGIIWRAG